MSTSDNIQDNIQTKIDQLNDLCSQYYATTSDSLELIEWISRVANNLELVSIDSIRQRFFMIRINSTNIPLLDRIRQHLINVVSLQYRRPESLIRMSSHELKAKNIDDLITGLKNGSIAPPKVPFTAERTVKMIKNDEITDDIIERSKRDEIDSYRQPYLDRAFIIEPSMEPLTSVIWNLIDVSKFNEHDMRQVVNGYLTEVSFRLLD